MGPLPDGVCMPAAVVGLPGVSVGRAWAGTGATGSGWEEVGLVLRAIVSGWGGRKPSMGRRACRSSPQMVSGTPQARCSSPTLQVVISQHDEPA